MTRIFFNRTRRTAHPAKHLFPISVGLVAAVAFGTARAQSVAPTPNTIQSPADIAQEGLRRQEQRLREQQQQLQPLAMRFSPRHPPKSIPHYQSNRRASYCTKYDSSGPITLVSAG